MRFYAFPVKLKSQESGTAHIADFLNFSIREEAYFYVAKQEILFSQA